MNRYINLIAVQMKTTTNQDMRRYERANINEASMNRLSSVLS
ncbi:hypothetical protein [Eshraghiella crossota]